MHRSPSGFQAALIKAVCCKIWKARFEMFAARTIGVIVGLVVDPGRCRLLPWHIIGRSCRVAVRLLVAIGPLMSIATNTASAAALVGETGHIATEPATAPTLTQLHSQYRRPDTIPFPSSNPYTAAKATLGQALFFDTRLSRSGALSCASCHNPGFSFGDGRATAPGDHNNTLSRRSPSIVNNAWGDRFMWDGRFRSLEEQVAGPIENPNELNQSMDLLVRMLSEIGEYRSLFANAFPNQAITPKTLAASIATYERTIVSAMAPFDRWIDGDESAVSDAAKRGFTVFNTKGRCASCHGGWLFTDDGFHDIGLPGDDPGRGRILPRVSAMQHAFKTPSLRETDKRGPYMHNGSLPTLQAVVAHYNTGGAGRPGQSELVTALSLSVDEQADLIAFLRSLTSAMELNPAPALPH